MWVILNFLVSVLTGGFVYVHCVVEGWYSVLTTVAAGVLSVYCQCRTNPHSNPISYGGKTVSPSWRRGAVLPHRLPYTFGGLFGLLVFVGLCVGFCWWSAGADIRGVSCTSRSMVLDTIACIFVPFCATSTFRALWTSGVSLTFMTDMTLTPFLLSGTIVPLVSSGMSGVYGLLCVYMG